MELYRSQQQHRCYESKRKKYKYLYILEKEEISTKNKIIFLQSDNIIRSTLLYQEANKPKVCNLGTTSWNKYTFSVLPHLRVQKLPASLC